MLLCFGRRVFVAAAGAAVAAVEARAAAC